MHYGQDWGSCNGPRETLQARRPCTMMLKNAEFRPVLRGCRREGSQESPAFSHTWQHGSPLPLYCEKHTQELQHTWPDNAVQELGIFRAHIPVSVFRWHSPGEKGLENSTMWSIQSSSICIHCQHTIVVSAQVPKSCCRECVQRGETCKPKTQVSPWNSLCLINNAILRTPLFPSVVYLQCVWPLHFSHVLPASQWLYVIGKSSLWSSAQDRETYLPVVDWWGGCGNPLLSLTPPPSTEFQGCVFYLHLLILLPKYRLWSSL